VVGISLPVWVKDGKSSEPANEVFCKYYLTNIPQDENLKLLADGYKINLPQKFNDWQPPELCEEIYRGFTRRERARWYRNNFPARIVAAKNLLDVKEGGSESINYREYNKVYHESEAMDIIHYINISDIKRFEESSTITQSEGHSHSD